MATTAGPRVLAAGAFLNLVVTLAPRFVRWNAGAWRDPRLGLFAIGVTAFYLGDAWSEVPPPRLVTTAADRLSLQWSRATGLALLAAFWIGAWGTAGDAHPASSLVPFLGCILMVAGGSLRQAARRALGPQFVTEVTPLSGHRLVGTGLYGRLRHPSEVGLLFAVTGAALVFSSAVVAAVALAFVAPLAVARIHLEERELRFAHGAEYARYCARVPR